MSQITKQQFNAFTIIVKLPEDLKIIIEKIINNDLMKKCMFELKWCKVYNFREQCHIDELAFFSGYVEGMRFNCTEYGLCYGLYSESGKYIRRSLCLEYEKHAGIEYTSEGIE
eukprot:Lithocolla_globosa_v1_NODE_13135_length_386_cov_242.148036.p1 type:complete len:113 gc:universal NODE_13135_length_386_cov_242.148036:21-359(+)